ncbi:hypothetical protein BGX29_008882 [Mortierella sp. GBA35]|nr:hypothetical protein BGX29_008882 [Mortierella sp. GBA35]
MGNTLVGPGVLRDSLEYPSHGHHISSSSYPPFSGPIGGLGGLLATPSSSSAGGRFRRSYFGQFVFLLGLLSLIVFLQDSLLAPDRRAAVTVEGDEEWSNGEGDYRRAEVVQQELREDERAQLDEQVQRFKMEEGVGETVAAAMAAALANHGGGASADGGDDSRTWTGRKEMRTKTKQWMKTVVNIITGHEKEMVDDEGLVVFIPDTKQQEQEGKEGVVSSVLDVPGQVSGPEYQSFPPQVPLSDVNEAPLPLHAKYQWTSSSIQKALDPNQHDDIQQQRPRSQDNHDDVSRIVIAQWQQVQDLVEFQGRNDNYEHEIDNLRHQIEEQESDMNDLRRQLDELRVQNAAFEAELE